MRIGLSMPLPAYTIDPAFMGRTAELLGFESICTPSIRPCP